MAMYGVQNETPREACATVQHHPTCSLTPDPRHRDLLPGAHSEPSLLWLHHLRKPTCSSPANPSQAFFCPASSLLRHHFFREPALDSPAPRPQVPSKPLQLLFLSPLRTLFTAVFPSILCHKGKIIFGL